MSAPVFWIIVPLILSGLLWLLRNERLTAILACFVTFLWAFIAWLLPIDSILDYGNLSFKITPTLEILGRQLNLTVAKQPILAMIYTSVLVWFVMAAVLGISRQFIPTGLAITALLVASLAVEPFLYAILLIEIAALLSVPLLTIPNQKPGRGVLRFIIFQTLAIPFILFSGWLLAGIEANPGDSALVVQASILLGFGFILLLAIFPFHTWLPLLAEESPPYAVGFILWAYSSAGLLFLTNLLERYTWLRSASILPNVLSVAGLLMVVTGGLFTVLERHLNRMMAYAVIAETGFSLLALSLNNFVGLNVFFALFFPRIINLGIWTFSLSVLQQHAPSLHYEDVKGLGRAWSFSTAGLILASLSLAGIPILVGFPIRLSLFEGLAKVSQEAFLVAFFSSVGIALGAIRTLGILVTAPEGTPWEVRESWTQRVFFILGWILLFALGFFPQIGLPLLSRLPTMFEHLGR